MTHTSLYDQLLAKGYTDETIRAAAGKRGGGPRTFSIALADTPDGPIVGLKYSCDFRAEEEWGVSKLYAALGGGGTHTWRMMRGTERHATSFEGVHSLIISTRTLSERQVWGQDITGPAGAAAHGTVEGSRYNDTYDDHYNATLGYAQRMGERLNLRWATVEELREIARRFQLTGPLPRKKADLQAAILAAPAYAATAEEPDVWPGWFHFGDTLVLRADRGIVADLLDLLGSAAAEHALAFGQGQAVFGSGMAFYDARDVGPLLRRQRKVERKAYDRAMKALAPVAEQLKAKGHNWYALGRPTTLDTGDGRMVERYWLNSYGRGPGYNHQIYGWFTLQELASEDFVGLFAAHEAAKGR